MLDRKLKLLPLKWSNVYQQYFTNIILWIGMLEVIFRIIFIPFEKNSLIKGFILSVKNKIIIFNN